jgi:hypothetical protein
MIRMFLSVIIFSLYYLSSVSFVYACSCVAGISPCEALKNTPHVFIGRVVDISNSSSSQEDPELLTFEVEQSFKGLQSRKVKMWQGTGSGDCSLVFDMGERYLIYANYDNETKLYSTGLCTRSSAVKYASEDLDYLRGLPSSASKNRISGIVVRYDYDYDPDSTPEDPELIAGIKIVIADQYGKRLETVTDTDGYYKFIGIPAGKYRIDPVLPQYLTLERSDSKAIDMSSKGCISVNFFTRTNGKIKGVVLDDEKRPVPDIYVDILPVELADKIGDPKYGSYKKSDVNGNFEFNELKKGRYYIGVNIRRNPEGDTPFPRTFYPNASNIGEAEVIDLHRGENLEGYKIQLPKRLKVRQIEGSLTWPDGKPVVKGMITLKDSPDREDGQSIAFENTDSSGNFSIIALEGIEAWIHASSFVEVKDGLQVFEADPVKVKVQSGIAPVRLVLSRRGKGGLTYIQ